MNNRTIIQALQAKREEYHAMCEEYRAKYLAKARSVRIVSGDTTTIVVTTCVKLCRHNIKVMNRHIEAIALLEAFIEEHGEFDEALFLLYASGHDHDR